jgi:hypothetical protein
MTGPNPALTREQAAAYCGVSVRHFTRAILPFVPAVDQRGPGARRPLWRVRQHDLDQWLERRRVGGREGRAPAGAGRP